MFRAWDTVSKSMHHIGDLYWFEEEGVHTFGGTGHYGKYKIMPDTGETDKYGETIYVGDIVQYNTLDDFDVQAVVKFGKYLQDGSDGEYNATECIGIYVEVDNFTCPDWTDDPSDFKWYLKTQNILEVVKDCRVIGNIYENPELLSNKNTNI